MNTFIFVLIQICLFLSGFALGQFRRDLKNLAGVFAEKDSLEELEKEAQAQHKMYHANFLSAKINDLYKQIDYLNEENLKFHEEICRLRIRLGNGD